MACSCPCTSAAFLRLDEKGAASTPDRDDVDAACGRGAWCDPRHRSARGAGEWRLRPPCACGATKSGVSRRYLREVVNPYQTRGAEPPVKRVTLRGVTPQVVAVSYTHL